MLKLKSVVLNMSEEDFTSFSGQLKDNKAEKFSMLLCLYRENKASDEEIASELSMNQNTFYTLKSRLYEKVQEFLLSNIDEGRIDLLKKISNIDKLVYNSHRDTAVAMLTKLEKELLEHDMPYELTSLYNALKKLHLHSPKYYDYTQQYNKHVAYTLALDKAEDLLMNFTKLLGDYFASRDKSLFEMLWLLKKEMANVCRLYESHHLKVYKNILDISFAVFVPFPEALKDDLPVQDVLNETDTIMKQHPNDLTYQYLKLVFDFLSFEYYFGLKQTKKAGQFYENLNRNISTLLLCNHCCVPSKFLLSKLEWSVIESAEEALVAQNKNIAFESDKSDIPNHVNYVKYLAVSHFYSRQYAEAAQLLNTLLNEVSFKKYPHAEMEVKILLALFYSMLNKYEQAEMIVKNASRKAAELNKDEDYENAIAMMKMLKIQLVSEQKNPEEKIKKQRDKFHTLNSKHTRMFEYMKLDDNLMKLLARSVK